MYHLIVVRCIIFQRYQAYGNEGTPNRIAYLLDRGQSKNSEFRSQYYTEALNYLN
ncbi:hypothetical protein GKD14_17645 [Paeniclostridium sordellii]|nr:hypothetical protein [Paeniclostridium sordellii]